MSTKNSQNSQKKKFHSVADISRTSLNRKIRDICLSDSREGEDAWLGGLDEHAFAEFDKQNDCYLLERTHLFTEGVDFDLTYHPLQHLGYKIGVASTTDILCMNGKPEYLSVCVSIPNKISVEMLEQFFEGIARFCTQHEISFSTVNVGAAQHIFTVSLSVRGRVSRNHLTRKRHAELDDAICVTGDIGSAIAGLRILLREKKYWESRKSDSFQPVLSEYEYVVKRQLLPEARFDFIDLFHAESIIPNAITSVSEGLLYNLSGMCKASNTGFYLFQAALPISLPARQVADEMDTDVDKYALYGGEDYELVFTLPRKKVEKLSKITQDFAVIGKIVDYDKGFCMQNAEGDVIKFEE